MASIFCGLDTAISLSSLPALPFLWEEVCLDGLKQWVRSGVHHEAVKLAADWQVSEA